jgi:murein DD-endopeptidase
MNQNTSRSLNNKLRSFATPTCTDETSRILGCSANPAPIRLKPQMPRPARDHRTFWVALVLLLLPGLTRCGSSPAIRQVGLAAVDPHAVIATARTQLGIPYRPGGKSPQTGFDCSGFTSWVFVRHGLSLPRQSYDQFRIGQSVEAKALRAGDLVFFEVDKQGASHVGIYSGGGGFIHCSSSGGRVREDTLAEKYWRKHYLGARRILQ